MATKDVSVSEIKEAFRPDFARKHGCAWFVWPADGQHQPDRTGGWASIAGEPAFEFHRPQDLPKSITWWTNLSKAEAWSLGKWQHIKHAGFLGPQWLTLMSEWGFPATADDVKKSCAAWSEVFARLAHWLSQWASSEQSDPDPTPPWSWGDGDFHEALAHRLGWTQPAVNQQPHPVFADALLPQVEVPVPAYNLRGMRKLSLPRPYASHARAILSSRYPLGAFKPPANGVVPRDNDAIWAWLATSNHPILVRFDEITWRTGCETQAALWWGLRGKRFAPTVMDPVWLTAEEALDMHAYIDANPTAFLVAEGWQTGDYQDVRFPLESQGWIHELSIIEGFLLSALWQAAASTPRYSARRQQAPATARAVWYRATDRRLLFKDALAMASSGFQVLSYGQGQVTVLFDPDKTFPVDWCPALANTGLAVPTNLSESVEQSAILSADSALLWIKQKQGLIAALNVDRLVWPWLSHENQGQLKPVMEAALKDLVAIPAPNQEWANTWRNDLIKQAKLSVKSVMEARLA